MHALDQPWQLLRSWYCKGQFAHHCFRYQTAHLPLFRQRTGGGMSFLRSSRKSGDNVFGTRLCTGRRFIRVVIRRIIGDGFCLARAVRRSVIGRPEQDTENETFHAQSNRWVGPQRAGLIPLTCGVCHTILRRIVLHKS
jgi:hypothetical protein